jgi:hypothetical protein
MAKESQISDHLRRRKKGVSPKEKCSKTSSSKEAELLK